MDAESGLLQSAGETEREVLDVDLDGCEEILQCWGSGAGRHLEQRQVTWQRGRCNVAIAIGRLLTLGCARTVTHDKEACTNSVA